LWIELGALKQRGSPEREKGGTFGKKREGGKNVANTLILWKEEGGKLDAKKGKKGGTGGRPSSRGEGRGNQLPSGKGGGKRSDLKRRDVPGGKKKRKRGKNQKRSGDHVRLGGKGGGARCSCKQAGKKRGGATEKGNSPKGGRAYLAKKLRGSHREKKERKEVVLRPGGGYLGGKVETKKKRVLLSLLQGGSPKKKSKKSKIYLKKKEDKPLLY